MRLLYADDFMALMFICKDALYAKWLGKIRAERLNWLHCDRVELAILFYDALLIGQRLKAVTGSFRLHCIIIVKKALICISRALLQLRSEQG